MPLEISSTKIYFESWAPSQKELRDCPHIHVTSHKEWDPSQVSLKQITTIATNKPNGMKEKLIKMISAVSKQDNTMKDLPTQQTYSSTEWHYVATGEVLAD